MSDTKRQNGHVIDFNIGSNRGTILSEDQNEYKFDMKIISGKIPELGNYPAVFFEVAQNEITSVAFDPDTPRLKEAPRSGLAILGAAKCPNCDWRLPLLPSAGMPRIRKGERFSCPQCNKLLKLKSILVGRHHYFSAGILIIGIIAVRFVPWWGIKLLIIFITILTFIYIHLLEKLVIDDVGDTFE
jgi:ssDNA-binding Zn-finger/Zn-ribbon topoisomerase 1